MTTLGTDAERASDGSSRHRLAEITRRLALLGGAVVAVSLTFWTGFEPYLKVSRATPDQIAEALGRREERPRSANALLARRPARNDGRLVTVSGARWEAFFAGVTTSFAENQPIAGWEHRVQGRDQKQARTDNRRRAWRTADTTFGGSFHTLYFLAKEAPFSDVAGGWKEGRRYVLQRAEAPEVRLMVAYLPAYQLAGFFDVITLPEAFSYPYPSLAPWAALLGLVVYLVIPWRRAPANVVAYQRWRIILGDVAGLLMAAVFFGMPIAAIGGTLEAMTTFLPFTLAFWLVAGLGLVGLYWSTWAAVYHLAILPSGLDILSLSGRTTCAYTDIEAAQPVRLLPPRWLRALSWLAALQARSPAQTAGQVGRALLLSTSATNGLRLDLRGGRRVYVWYSDQMGGTAVQHFERLGQALRREGIRWADSPVDIRAVFPPTT